MGTKTLLPPVFQIVLLACGWHQQGTGLATQMQILLEGKIRDSLIHH